MNARVLEMQAIPLFCIIHLLNSHIKFVILPTVNHTILIMLVLRI